MTSANGSPNIPNGVTRTLICVDNLGEADFSGLLYNPYLPEPVPFGQVKDILRILERFFNHISYPQSYYQNRSFLNPKPEPSEPKPPVPPVRHQPEEILEEHRGGICTFLVEVRFRQHATWQGDVQWREGGETRRFRSALELIKLMDGVTRGGRLKKKGWSGDE